MPEEQDLGLSEVNRALGIDRVFSGRRQIQLRGPQGGGGIIQDRGETQQPSQTVPVGERLTSQFPPFQEGPIKEMPRTGMFGPEGQPQSFGRDEGIIDRTGTQLERPQFDSNMFTPLPPETGPRPVQTPHDVKIVQGAGGATPIQPVSRSPQVRRRLQRAQAIGRRAKMNQRATTAKRGFLDQARRKLLGLQAQDNRRRTV